MSMLAWLYRRVMGLMHAAAPGILARRAAAGKEDPARLVERLGHFSAARPPGALIWFHGVSVGESLSLLPLISALGESRPDLNFLITSATTTSAELLAKRLPSRTQHAYAPIDTPQAVEGFVAHWRPQAAIFAESEIWPNLLGAIKDRNIPHALISARITAKTARGWLRFQGLFQPLLAEFGPVLAQDTASQARLEAMGVKVSGLANLKTVGEAPNDDPDTREAFAAQISPREVILAASTHAPEEGLIAEALKVRILDGALLIIAPRHPRRAPEISADLKALGFRVVRRANGDKVEAETGIYLADTLGELGIWMRLAQLIIMGGSFSDGIGGHNPLEAARLGKAVITGSDISNWEGIYGDLIAAGGAFRVADRGELGFLADQLLGTPEAIHRADSAASGVAQSYNGTLDTIIKALMPVLPPLLPEGEHGA